MEAAAEIVEDVAVEGTLGTPFDFEPEGDKFEQVYGFLAELRQRDPVFFSQKHGGWIVSRYDDIAAVVKSENFTVENVLQAAQNGSYCPEAAAILSSGVDWNMTRHVQSDDSPDHARFRRAIMGVINPKRLREMQPVVSRIVDRLIDRFIDRGACEYVSEFAYPLAMMTVLNLIGFHEGEDDMSRFPIWIDDTFRLILTAMPPAEQVTAATHAVEFQNYIRNKIRARRADCRDDLLTEILDQLSSGRANLTEDELVIMFTHSFVGAGHETTKLALTNSIFHLLEERSRWEQLLANPDKVSAFVEESLRFDPPLLAWFRYCTIDTEIGGQMIRKGDKVVLMLGSANHDERKYARSEEFCPFRREATPHMTFSSGRHFCIGAPLARIELNTALATLARRIPNLRLKEGQEIVYVPTFGNRVISALHLEWDA
jgi:cytochrome P450